MVANVGCGPLGGRPIPDFFNDWQEVRIDVDPIVAPDILGDLTDLSEVPNDSIDAVWASHCIEHLYIHEVPTALAEFRRVLRSDGFACILVPDLQSLGAYLSSDRVDDPAYNSPSGPITPHDMLYGYGRAIADGRTSMAHRCGFTPKMLMKLFKEAGFESTVIVRRQILELVAVVYKSAVDQSHNSALLSALEL